MNKQEAMKRVELMGEYEPFVDEPISKRSVLSTLSQIHEPQKPVVPKFVAEWIEEAKKCHNNLSWVWFSNPVCDELNDWLKNHTETFMIAWLFGYEVEQEKLYTVEIPNPNDNEITVLERTANGVVLAQFGRHEDNWKKERVYCLTESEIKKDFEWAWQWAKEVE